MISIFNYMSFYITNIRTFKKEGLNFMSMQIDNSRNSPPFIEQDKKLVPILSHVLR
jgi:hypothetical protein